MPKHSVAPGDCLSSLVLQHGVAPDRIWDASANAELRARRGDPNVLAKGDVVDVPAREIARPTVEANRRHVFRLSHTHVTLRLRLELPGEPIADEPYVLTVGKRRFEGRTDADGNLEQRVRADAKQATLLLVDRNEELVLDLGHLDPADDWRGVSQRLRNLGVWSGPIRDTPNEALRTALISFQREHDRPPTGEIDEPTTAALVAAHGS